jgi:hypothetical protein
MVINRKALAYCVLAVLCLVAGCALGLFFPGALPIAVAGGFVGYVFCGRCAVAAWKLNERVFEDRPRLEDHRRRPPTPMAVASVFLFAALALPLCGQQTIFNVPSADVLDPGKVYVETDELFRPSDPKFSSTTVRGVVGIVPRLEAGVNFGGLVAPGPVVPTATVAVKIQPLKIGDFAASVGGFGLFYLKGNEDGEPAGMGYGFVTYRVTTLQTRVSLGGWYASAGFAHPLHRPLGSSTGGALMTLEQPLPWVKGLSVAADWWSGENSIGYLSPGLVYSLGPWTAYAAYSIKNADSEGNAGLIELGYAF